MSISLAAAVAPSRAVHAPGTTEQMCGQPQQGSGPCQTAPSSIAALFPPRDADADTRAAWLARSPWPEVVFASAR